MTTTPSAPPLIAERADIHKSCKAIESLLNLLDDYSQVTSAMAALEKKLAKAIRELAGLKMTGEIAANACNVSANVFETSSDISGKFAKIADKEYNGLGSDVRKWFKKLAKEERTHDEHLSSANAKIKQAGELTIELAAASIITDLLDHKGQAYEKKSRKNARDAAEEHARYINLISILGPEISKDKYEHGISITRQHISTTCGVAACLSRIADAEWLRACESIRRFSASIGPLGEWRALCEGGWERPLPYELPDIHSIEMDRSLLDARISGTPRREPAQTAIQREQRAGGPSSYPTSAELGDDLMPDPLQSQATSNSHADLDASTYSNQGSNTQSLNSSPLQPPKPLVDPNTGSVRSLSAFPTPPTHFPIPPPQVTPPRSATFQPAPSGLNPNISIPRTASPVGDDSLRAETPTQDVPATPSVSEQGEMLPPSLENNCDSPMSESTAKATEFAATGGTTSSSYVAAMRHRYTTSSGANSPPQKDILRLPTKVADLATRYESPEPPVSPSFAKRPSVRQQSNHVITAANQSDESYFGGAMSESSQTSSHKEQAKLDDFKNRERQLLEFERELALKARDLEREKEELDKARRDNTKQVPASSGLSAFAQQLIPRSRERRISLRRQQQSQKLEIPSRSSQDVTESPSSATQHSYHTAHSPSQQGPAPLTPSSSSGAQQGHYAPYSRHKQQSVESSTQDTHSSSQPPSPNLTRPPNLNHRTQNPELSSNRAFPQTRPQSRDRHPSYCGCERCSAKYSEANNSTPDPHSLRPPEQPIVLRPSASDNSDGMNRGNNGNDGKRSGTDRRAEKAKGGWMRRLSMPVVMGHALNLDSSSSKKTNQRESSSSSSLYALGAGIGNTPLPNPGTKGGLFSLDGKKNASSTNLRFGVREDGRILSGRRSYETSILANRSMTNLGLGGKR